MCPMDAVQSVDQKKIHRCIEQGMRKQKYQVGEESLSTMIGEAKGEQ